MNGNGAPDPIDAAIAATEPAPTKATVLNVTLATGRQIGLGVPLDLTADEALMLVGFIAGGLGPELAKRRAGPVLEIARAIPRA